MYILSRRFHTSAVVRKTGDRPTVAAFLNRDFARNQEWCNYWWIILNPDKTKALVVSKSRTVNKVQSPHCDLVLFGVSICASPNLDIFGVKFNSKLTFEDHVLGIVSRVSQKFCILRQVKRIFVDTMHCVTSLLLWIRSPNPGVLFSGGGVSWWMSTSSCRVPGVFSNQALPWSEFLAIMSSTSCCWTGVYIVQG